ncbi:MAG: hypothetical protein JKY93_01135 [Gammaproteobacteria bacterium]|nr:hypothetical protein [Gammaproteobacteria bacterium]
MGLLSLESKRTYFSIRVKGREKRLLFRPFILRDEAWLQRVWDLENLSKKILDRDVHTIAKIIWHQLEPKSKQMVMNIKATYIDVDPQTGKKIKVNPQGYARLIEFLDTESFDQALSAWNKVRKINSASLSASDNKKKIKKPTGMKSLILYLLNMAIPTNKYLT